MEFTELIEARRSASNFDNVIITESDLKTIFDDLKLTPSGFNLQHTELLVKAYHRTRIPATFFLQRA